MVFKLSPAYKDYLWGGNKLKTQFGKQFSGDILAESWELSCHEDGQSVIASGEHTGTKFGDFVRDNAHVLGTNCKGLHGFPILIKFIDAKKSLSIQVHPKDDYAKEHEGDSGKTEMWYIVNADENAFIYYGFTKEITREEYKKRIDDNTLLEVLNKISVKKGDCFFIEAGTVHAIGEGCLIAEVQQSSNVTYRVYDFARKDADGNLRELHIDKALDVSTLLPEKNSAKKSVGTLVSCNYFTVDLINTFDENANGCGCLAGTNLFCGGHKPPEESGFENCGNAPVTEIEVSEKTFKSLLILEGSGAVKNGDVTLNFEKGDSIFAAAGCGKLLLSGKFSALVSYV